MTVLAALLEAPAPAPKPTRDNGSDTAILVAYMAVFLMYSGRRSRSCLWHRKPKASQPTA